MQSNLLWGACKNVVYCLLMLYNICAVLCLEKPAYFALSEVTAVLEDSYHFDSGVCEGIELSDV